MKALFLYFNQMTIRLWQLYCVLGSHELRKQLNCNGFKVVIWPSSSSAQLFCISMRCGVDKVTALIQNQSNPFSVYLYYGQFSAAFSFIILKFSLRFEWSLLLSWPPRLASFRFILRCSQDILHKLNILVIHICIYKYIKKITNHQQFDILIMLKNRLKINGCFLTKSRNKNISNVIIQQP